MKTEVGAAQHLGGMETRAPLSTVANGAPAFPVDAGDVRWSPCQRAADDAPPYCSRS